jgi:hypothetical protein
MKPDLSLKPPVSPVPQPPPAEVPLANRLPAEATASPDWQTSVQKIYDRKTQERRPHYEGDPQRYRQVAADLMDGLVHDTATIVPPGYPSLGLPSPRGAYPYWREITGTTFLEHQIVRGDASTQRVDLVFAKVAWEVLGQFGIEAAYVLLLLTTRLAKARYPWEEIVELNTADLLHLNLWERDVDLGRGKRLRLAGNWFELVCNLSLLINQIDPVKSRFTALRIPFWVLEEMEYGGTVSGAMTSGRSLTVGGAEPEEARDLTIRVGLGLWSEQFVATADDDKRESLVQFGHQAGTLLQLDPHRKAQAAKLGILLMLLDRMHSGQSQFYAVGSILEQLESKAALIEMRRRRDRLHTAFSRWNASLQTLKRLGWAIEFEAVSYPPPLQPTWQHPDGDRPPINHEAVQWFDQWLQARIRVTPPLWVEPEPEPVALSLSDRFTGRNLAQALELKGLSQSKLADHLKLDRSMVTYWIKGARLIQPKHREQICALLGEELAQVGA